MKYFNGRHYIGEYTNGKMHGEGIFTVIFTIIIVAGW